MFNLEQSIAEWRRKMAAAGIKSSAVLDELESHLREDIEQQMRAGTTAERAFHEAAQRVGAADQLKLEFGKITRVEPRFSLRAQHICCATIALFVLLTEGWTLLAYDVTPAERISGLTLVFAIAGYIAALPYLNRTLWVGVRGWGLRHRIASLCNFAVLLWVCLLMLSLAKINLLPTEIVLSAVCWGLTAAAAITVVVIAYGMESQALDLWSPTASRSFELAGIEATHFHHDFIGTEHVLLGLLGDEDGTVSAVLRKMGVRRETVRAEIEKIVASGPQSLTNRAPVYTPRAKRAIRIAIQEAKAARHNRVEAEHIFLGLLREGGGVAAKVLTALGVDTTTAREQLASAAGKDDHAQS